ncbi:response regulator transcription factor [Halosegnis marinus]|uniref:Response regulator transcription factor n=1 Tax=Halosegnis marinus TaxID=3034023 RepID=A0ABD5ZL34_9EURY|nr:response regulator [Halosegnis sp. DT85]
MTEDSDDPSVLVVDDEPRVAEGYATWLADDYEVRVATDGDEALAEVAGAGVVVLDRRMPGRSGDEVLRALRERDADCRVAMATAVDPERGDAALPFDAYLTKPVERDELRATVERLAALSTYADRFYELTSLRVRRNVLEVETNGADEEVAELNDRIDELESRLAAIERAADIEGRPSV